MGGTVRRGRLVACVCLLGHLRGCLVTSLDYSLMDALGPGPGFFPFWLSLLGAALTVAILAETARSHDIDTGSILLSRQAAWQVGRVLIALGAAAALLEPLGFRLTMLLFIAGLLFALGARSPFAILLTALAGSFGVLPGLGPAAGTAILIPLTFTLDPIGALIMLSAIYYGGMYGGTITSVLINVPGEAASVVTCFDGYQMAKQGRGGTALGIAAIGSFVGGIAATVALIVVAPPLARIALSFGPPEFFALMVVGLCLITGLGGQSLLTGLVMAVLGLLIAMVG